MTTDSSVMQSSKTRRRMTYQQRRATMTFVLLTLIAAIITIPVIWLVLTSLKSQDEYISVALQVLPRPPQWENYYLALTMIDFARYARNSVFLSVLFATLTVITSSMAGYAFARIPAAGKSKIFPIVVALILIPGSIYIIPQFILFSQMHLVNSYWPWVLWALGASPFHIFLFRQFFMAFPAELEEAAEVDGARTFRIFAQIVLPNSYPALATSFILNFLYVWGDWVLPLLYLTESNMVLPVKLINAYVNPQGYPIVPPTLAASVLYILPPIIMFFIVQKYIMQGVVTSGLKG